MIRIVRGAVGRSFRRIASRASALVVVLFAPAAASAQTAHAGARVRVVELGTHKSVAGAVVDRYASEIVIFDSWRKRIVGDDLLPQKEAEKAKQRREPTVPGTASTWITDGGSGRAISDAAGIALFDEPFEGGATLVASTPSLRGARVVVAKEGEAAPAIVELEIGPPRTVDVQVVGAGGAPCAGIPVEFGRFLELAQPRESGDSRYELWDRLGTRVLTDEKGRAKLVDLELHSVDDLDVLRGAEASPFCARAIVLGAARVVAVVDPDAPPKVGVTLALPAVGSIELSIELLDHRKLEVEGDVEVFAAGASLAPGFQRVVEVHRGRARFFPVEAGLAGKIGLRGKLLENGNLTATAIQLGATFEPVFGDTFLPRIESSCALPHVEGERIDATLALPTSWFQVCMRLLDSAGRPQSDAEVDSVLVAAIKHEDAAAKTPPTYRQRDFPRTKCDADGRVAIFMRRPLVPADLSIELTAISKSGVRGGSAGRPLVFGDDAWRIDLGDVLLDR